MVDTINIDAGGTFTDGYITWKDDHESIKVPTTPHDLTECFFECIERGADEIGTDIETLLEETDLLRLSTTLGTNAIIERTGPKLGVIVSEGAEESLYADGMPDEFLVDRDMIRTVDDQVTTEGTVEKEVDQEAALDEVRTLVSSGARMIVVALKNAAHNPANEEAIRQAVRDRYPQHYLRSIPVQISTEVMNIPDDRRRTMAAIVNAYIHRQMVKNLYKAEDRVRESGYDNPLLAVHSDGGATRIAKTKAINTYSSGPAAGLIGTAKIADQYDFDGVVAADMGGTSVDVAVVEQGEYDFDMTPEVADVEIAVPMLRMYSIGAGGGSIASVENGELTVGPESAGAQPGPACYGLGGNEPTVTDADVVLGYINPEYFLGGERDLDVEGAREAIESHVADPLGCSVEEAARRIKERVDKNIGEDLAELSERRDLDLDALFAFGGAGPLHAPGFAEEAGISTVVTFPFGSVFNAFGQSSMDVLHTYTEAVGSPLTSVEGADLEKTVADMEAEALLDMRGEGFDADDVTFEIEAVCNHPDGERQLIAFPDSLSPSDFGDLADSYSTGNGTPHADEIQFEAVRLSAGVPIPDPEMLRVEIGESDPSEARQGSRDAYWEDGKRETPIYEYDSLIPGHVVVGPAVIEATDTTYTLPDGWKMQIDEYANGILKYE